ncbi:MAG: diadenylate cyclase CdaA, partial [Tannerella sp.]|nr:diadenylate cyclase CdaA [Tannerella sp.]
MFISFGVKDAIDIILVAFLMYQTYKLMKSSGTLTIFSGVVSIIAVWVLVSQVLEMRLMGAILDKFISVGFIVLVIIFQDEIRRFLIALGSNRGWRFFYNFFRKRNDGSDDQKFIAPVVLACMNLAKKKTGALIVIQHEMDLSPYIQTGEMFTADVNARLVENIFFKNSPLHDGAMIIVDNNIKAAGCILPVAHNVVIPKEMGLRHRSGLGMSIETDALVIIVSEERGTITVAHNGKLNIDASA